MAKTAIKLAAILVVIGVAIAPSYNYAAPHRHAANDARPKAQPAPSQNNQYLARPLFGETHLHTINSGDAAVSGTRVTPEDAIRFGRGDEVTSSSGQKAKLARPLDFIQVSDHAELIGTGAEIYNGNSEYMKDPTLRRWNAAISGPFEGALAAMREVIEAFSQGRLPAILFDPSISGPIIRSVWSNYLSVVDRYNDPGKYTVLAAFEFTSTPRGDNLHRIVMFRDSAERVGKILPFSSLESRDPAKLWDYMQNYETSTGGQVLAIPHNPNLSNGKMFALTDFTGNEFTAEYALRRQRWEPLLEVVQAKGDSEAHQYLSPNDEFADFGKSGWDIGNLDLSVAKRPEMIASEYAREALKRGILLEQRLGVNPFKFGMIGASDIHTGLSTADENNFMGENAVGEPRAERATNVEIRGQGLKREGWQSLGGSLAAVWAISNTREAIFDAMKRREVYATTGTRMSVRVFGGFGFTARDFGNNWVRNGYLRGVPMGGTLDAGSSRQAPAFMIDALKDPDGANLDRVQMVKGWVDANGQTHEKIYNVAWSNPRVRRMTANGNIGAVGDTVNIANATYSNTIGAPNLRTLWVDPEYNPNQRAFYYVRVLEIPTPRWPAYDAVRFNLSLPPNAITKSQERAYTSPIWISPR
ncbi:MAG: hypothetical protein FD163_2341 [Hyphomonadaceae bacterium]|nr:MAG: hypothetical protein FD163_2341 [Hyphomonadaceae bacterium]